MGYFMKCAVLVSSKMSGIPIVECGGIVLAPGDKLLVPCEQAPALKRHYGSLLIHAADEEKAKLKNGGYEVISGAPDMKAVIHSAHHDNADVPPMAEVTADKSMQGKARTVRRK